MVVQDEAYWQGPRLASRVFSTKVQNLALITRRHQASPDPGTFVKSLRGAPWVVPGDGKQGRDQRIMTMWQLFACDPGPGFLFLFRDIWQMLTGTVGLMVLSWWHSPGFSCCPFSVSFSWGVYAEMLKTLRPFCFLLFSCFQLWYISSALYIKSFIKIKTSNLILINKTKTKLIKLS